MQARDGYFSSGGSRLRYRDEGAGDAVVFLHGWTVDLDVWDPQAAELGASMRVIRLDRRGFGLSEGDPSLAADCDDVRALMDELRLRRAALVGASQGARVALAVALRSPERVTAIVLDGPPDETGEAGAGADADLSVDGFRELVRKEGVEAFRRAWRDHPLMRLHSDDAGARASLTRMLERYPARDLLMAVGGRVPPAGAAALSRLVTPALVVNGEHDTPVRLRAGEKLCRTLADAERVVVPGAGHLPNLDNPRAYNDALHAFFCRRARAAA